MLEKEWVFLDESISQAQAEAYAELFNIPVIVAKVLLNRGFTDAADAKKFLDKSSQKPAGRTRFIKTIRCLYNVITKI